MLKGGATYANQHIRITAIPTAGTTIYMQIIGRINEFFQSVCKCLGLGGVS
jgi:hypothetical protein